MNKPEPVSPLSSSGRTPDPDGSIPVCIRRWDEKLQQVVFAPLPAASPEGSAGLDAEQLKQALLESAEEMEAQIANNKLRHAASYRVQADQLRALAVVIGPLIDASRERDTERNRAATYWTHVLALEDVVASQAAQLTDARSRLKDCEECDSDYRASLRLAEAEITALRTFREQAITGIKVLPWGLWCQYLKVGNLDEIKGAVLSILRGAE